MNTSVDVLHYLDSTEVYLLDHWKGGARNLRLSRDALESLFGDIERIIAEADSADGLSSHIIANRLSRALAKVKP